MTNHNPHSKKNLSYSGYSKYVLCPKKYYYHYIEKLRPETEPFHLMFGKAVDQALNQLLADHSKFESALTLAKTELMRLFKESISFKEKDFDSDLFTERTLGPLTERLKTTGWEGEDPTALSGVLWQKLTFGQDLSANEHLAMKYLLYFMSVEKIVLMMNAFIDYVIPQIEEVHVIQKEVKRGIVDFEATFKGLGKMTVDNKTASYPYESDAVKWSVQLAGYGATKAMYIVFNKAIKKNRTKICSVCGHDGTGKKFKTCDSEATGKRCGGVWNETISPECVPQIIFEDVPERNREIVEEAYQEVERAVEAKCFPRNLTSCQKHFGRPCEFINLCWENKRDGLVIKPNEEDIEESE